EALERETRRADEVEGARRQLLLLHGAAVEVGDGDPEAVVAEREVGELLPGEGPLVVPGELRPIGADLVDAVVVRRAPGGERRPVAGEVREDVRAGAHLVPLQRRDRGRRAGMAAEDRGGDRPA